ncbi:hypothetical protein SCHPADRAFT_688703 [Schizopora paradoxa]|uniref:Uncharacterized protein n=1 Tax=Schizopora paradoxa TaxID=27342 RepID=A0A0H2RNV1_9AGAM|nr:hypothetical protein SCHPADRAFT_688703 [Schizopora paradoxa]
MRIVRNWRKQRELAEMKETLYGDRSPNTRKEEMMKTLKLASRSQSLLPCVPRPTHNSFPEFLSFSRRRVHLTYHKVTCITHCPSAQLLFYLSVEEPVNAKDDKRGRLGTLMKEKITGGSSWLAKDGAKERHLKIVASNTSPRSVHGMARLIEVRRLDTYILDGRAMSSSCLVVNSRIDPNTFRRVLPSKHAPLTESEARRAALINRCIMRFSAKAASFTWRIPTLAHGASARIDSEMA